MFVKGRVGASSRLIAVVLCGAVVWSGGPAVAGESSPAERQVGAGADTLVGVPAGDEVGDTLAVGDTPSAHNLASLTDELGGHQAVVREAILRVPRSQPEGVFKITSQIGPYPITVTGRMMNGVPRLSNIWVQ
jgi:hypothetical protein